jgi:membrane-anchored glycerophosphoryl diester phosphodiesterase (GDPDase)
MDLTIPIRESTFDKTSRFISSCIENCGIFLLIACIVLCIICIATVSGWALSMILCVIFGLPIVSPSNILSSPIALICIIMLHCICFAYAFIDIGILNIKFLPNDQPPKKKSLI